MTRGRLLLFAAALAAAGCAKPGQFEAVRAAVDAGDLRGFETQDQFAWELPNAHEGEFSSVRQLRVMMAGEAGENRPVSVVLGRERSTGCWRVLYAAREAAGGWERIDRGEAPAGELLVPPGCETHESES